MGGRDQRRRADDVLRAFLRRRDGRRTDHHLGAGWPVPDRRLRRGWKCSVSTPFGTTTAGAGINGENIAAHPLAAADQQIGRIEGRPRAQREPFQPAALGAARAPDDRNPQLPRDRRRRDPRERHRRVDDVGVALGGDAVHFGRDPPDAAQVARRQRETTEAARLWASRLENRACGRVLDAVFAQPVEAGGAGPHHDGDVEPELRQQRNGDRCLPFRASERRRRLQVEQPHPLRAPLRKSPRAFVVPRA